MKNIFIVDATLYWNNETPHFLAESLHEKNTTIDFLLQRLSFQNFSFVFLYSDSVPDSICQKFTNAGFDLQKTTPSVSIQDLLIKLKSIKDDRKADNLAFTYIDSPFLDIEINQKLIQMHLDNDAEYTFADNLPDGLSIELCSSDFLDEIVKSQPKQPELLSRRIFDNLQADINQFYVEVYLPDEDISLKRLEFHSNSKRNMTLLKNLLSHNNLDITFLDIVKTLNTHPEVVFIYPKYVEIELTNKNEPCFFIPSSDRKEMFMTFDMYKTILEKLTSQYNDIIVSLTGIGDPLLHPQFLKFVDYTITETSIFSLIVETTARTFSEDISQNLSAYPPQKLQIIFKVDAVTDATYKKLYEGNLSHVIQNIETFIQTNQENKQRTFLQFTKMKDNIEEMEPFYKYWHEKGVQVIIQKYNDYAGVLSNRTISDLTPLERLPCWHIQRDLTILADGTVPICKQDFDGKINVGNLNKNTIDEIHHNMLPFFLDNYAGKFETLKMCQQCDEWYTFNF